MTRLLISFGAAMIPVFLLVFLVHKATKERELTSKTPLTRRLLRPPGESLRRKIEELDEKLSALLLLLIFSCCGIGIAAWFSFENHLVAFSAGVFSVTLFVRTYFQCRSTAREFRDSRLGFLGERAVGEELNQLLADGWTVFHDVLFHDNPGQKPFNVDHVVVGLGGVYAIETKTRRKRIKQKSDDPKNEVIFTGSTLIYPWGEENFGVTQARQRAAHLARWLETQLKTEITVKAVLALPGWSVKRKAKSDLFVLSGREICSALKGTHKVPIIPKETVQAIKALLEQKCRDVE